MDRRSVGNNVCDFVNHVHRITSIIEHVVFIIRETHYILQLTRCRSYRFIGSSIVPIDVSYRAHTDIINATCQRAAWILLPQ